jgi:photosystem II stability/assembly factor-like uncharacterized protein
MKLVLLAFLSLGMTAMAAAQQITLHKAGSLADIHEQFEAYYEELESSGSLLKLHESENEEEDDDGIRTRFNRWEWLLHNRLMPDGTLPDAGIMAREHDAYLAAHPDAMALRTANWVQVGTNVLPSNGGGAGRINVIRFDPSNTSTIYIGTAGGGVWKSNDAGSTWTPISDNIPVLSIADIAIDPSNPSSIYIATGDGYGYGMGVNGDFWGGLYSAGILHSTDGGATWNTTGLCYAQSNNIIIQRLVLDPSNSNVLLAGTKTGLMRSIDAGANWTQVLTGRIYDIEYNTANSSTVYCAGNNNIYKSADGGATWSSIKSSVGSDRISIEVSAANAQVIYSLAIGGSLLKSTDGGATWTTKTFPTGASFYGYYDGVLSCSDANADLLIAAGSSMQKSTDGGSTWNSIGGGTVHSDHHSVEFLPGSSSTFYSGNDGGIYVTTNSGSGWTNISSGLMIAQLYRIATSAADPNIIYSGWQDNGSSRWNSNTNSWTKVTGGDGMDCMLDYSNTQNAYVTMQYGSLSRSTNGGSTWTTITPCSGNWVTPLEMDPLNSATIYQGCASIYKSTNSGTSWTIIGSNLFSTTSNNGCEDIAIAPSNTNTIYACSFNKMVKTTDGGSTWTTITGTLPVTNTGINQIAVSNTDPNLLWICLGGYSSGNKVFKSTDGGTTWTNVSGTLPNIPVNTIVYENGSADRLYIGTDIGVYYRDNNITDWTLYSTGLPNVMVHELEINYTSAKLLAATYGRGIWQSDLADAAVSSQSVINVTGNMSYGDVQVGSSSTKTLTIANTGNIPMNVSSISLPPGYSGNWSGTIDGGSSQGVNITFSPTTTQNYSGTINVESDAMNGTSNITCSGNGVSSCTLSTGTISPASICPGSTLDVTYNAVGSFNADNVFTAQLSNSSGSFTSPTNIGFISSALSGSITCAIPAGPAGSGYRVRVVSSSPAINGTDNGSNLGIACALPTGLAATNITANSATVSWTGNLCATTYDVLYKRNGNNPWIIVTGVTGTSVNLSGLNASSNYQWKVQATCLTNPLTTSGYTASGSFKTPAKKGADGSTPEVTMYPNPSSGDFIVESTTPIQTITVFNLLGQRVWKNENPDAATPAQIQLNVPGGLYFVEVKTEDGVITRPITIN